MVITNSDSNTTLVSLNNNNNKHYEDTTTKVQVDETTGLLRYVQTTGGRHASSSTGGTPTELLISIPEDDADDGMIEESSQQQQQQQESPSYVPLYLPSLQQSEPSDNVDEYISRNYYANDSDVPGSNVLKESRNRLLCNNSYDNNNNNNNTSPKIRYFGENSNNQEQKEEQQRLLYVAQGERANATTNQYDIIMSDKATTCHIIAFRSSTSNSSSTSNNNNNGNDNDNDNDLPLTSLTHLDGPHYDQCIRDMIDEHIHHHHQSNQQQSNQPVDNEEEKKCNDDDDYNNGTNSNNNNNDNVITIEIHIMGGFNDDDSSSSTITNWLLPILAQIANEYKLDQQAQPKVQMVIKTLVVSSSNNQQIQLSNNSNSNSNNSNNTIINSPIGRGLGIDLRTGEIFLAKCNTHTCGGPVPVLRSVRLWCREHQQHQQLSVVHTVQDVNNLWNSLNMNISQDDQNNIRNEYNLFWVQPIEFNSCSITNFDSLLQLEDDTLLQYTSTSPNVEEDGFCYDVRSSLQFLKSQSKFIFKQSKFNQQQQFFCTPNLNAARPMVFAKKKSPSTTTSNDLQQQQQWKQLPL
jgi:hypothetical protein